MDYLLVQSTLMSAVEVDVPVEYRREVWTARVRLRCKNYMYLQYFDSSSSAACTLAHGQETFYDHHYTEMRGVLHPCSNIHRFCHVGMRQNDWPEVSL